MTFSAVDKELSCSYTSSDSQYPATRAAQLSPAMLPFEGLHSFDPVSHSSLVIEPWFPEKGWKTKIT